MLLQNLKSIFFSILTCGLFLSISAQAQLSDDPASLPFPDLNAKDPHRAVAISVHFNSATDVTVQDVVVANTRYPGSVGAPPLILLELLDHNGEVIAEHNAWHPLWENQWDENEVESGNDLPSGPGLFLVPLSETLTSVRISDIELDLVLLTVDVQSEVMASCAAMQGSPICALYLNGFEN